MSHTGRVLLSMRTLTYLKSPSTPWHAQSPWLDDHQSTPDTTACPSRRATGAPLLESRGYCIKWARRGGRQAGYYRSHVGFTVLYCAVKYTNSPGSYGCASRWFMNEESRRAEINL